jgi:hypothetical protein
VEDEMNALKTLALTLATGFSVAACGSSAPANGPRPERAEQPRTEVRVENNSWSDVNVYAVEGGMRMRLGTVTSMHRERLLVPMSGGLFTRNVRLIAVPIGNTETFVSPELQVSRGQALAFTIQNRLAISSVAVYNR